MPSPGESGWNRFASGPRATRPGRRKRHPRGHREVQWRRAALRWRDGQGLAAIRWRTGVAQKNLIITPVLKTSHGRGLRLLGLSGCKRSRPQHQQQTSSTSPPCRCHHPTRVRPQARQPPWPEHNDKLTWCEICGRPHGRNPRPHRSDLRSGANADKVLGVYFSRPGHCALRPISPPGRIQAGSWLVRELPIKRRRTEVFV
jgi:hypothetical protein